MSDLPKLYIFNADNDLALASGQEFYTPPVAAQRIVRDFALLPVWWAADGSYILADNAPTDHIEWCNDIAAKLGKHVTVVNWRRLPRIVAEVEPWGWNQALLRKLSRFQGLRLPSPEVVATIRQLSHRRISIELLKAFAARCESIGAAAENFKPCHLPIELSDFEEVVDRVATHRGCFVKSPWSNSGRGVMQPFDSSQPTFQHWLRGALRTQGSVLIEDPLEGVQDFALEFKLDGGKARFEGYSVFSNDSRHSFASSIVAPAAQLRSLIASYCDADLLVEVTTRVLEEVIGPRYDGCLGIDMLAYSEGGMRSIHPCVELNLRRTMGHLTAQLGNALVADGERAEFRIEFSDSGFTDKASADGGIMLTPPSADAHYRALLAGQNVFSKAYRR